ncbi:MAG TPA: Rid family detoxifying hydrolase [Candidatus Dormibacteraeota bacterium]|nr:Rid family detoxifying hydrolase [Candidatus Dormibacteraeota bacterium]
MTPRLVVLPPPTAPPPVAPYSHAAIAGDLVFLSGQLPVDPVTGALVVGDFAARVRQTLVNLDAVLDGIGLDRTCVVRCGVYLTDMAQYAAMNDVYAAHFGDRLPARTCIGVTALALGADVEIDAIAARRDG